MLHLDKAYASNIGSDENNLENAIIRGCDHAPSLSILSLILSIPSTKAEIVTSTVPEGSTCLQLRCKDSRSTELFVSIPLRNAPSAPLLRDLHEAMMTATASLEAAMLEIIGVRAVEDASAKSLAAVEALHAPSIVHGESIEKQSAFRRVAGAEKMFLATRTLAVGRVASVCRTELFDRRRARKTREEARRKRERELVRVPRKKRGLFDVDDAIAPAPEEPLTKPRLQSRPQGDDKTKRKHEDVSKMEDEKKAVETSAETESKEAQRATAPPKKKKKRKVLTLV